MWAWWGQTRASTNISCHQSFSLSEKEGGKSCHVICCWPQNWCLDRLEWLCFMQLAWASFRHGSRVEGRSKVWVLLGKDFKFRGWDTFSGRPTSWEASCLSYFAMCLTITRESPVFKFNMYVFQYWIQHRLFAGCLCSMIDPRNSDDYFFRYQIKTVHPPKHEMVSGTKYILGMRYFPVNYTEDKHHSIVTQVQPIWININKY